MALSSLPGDSLVVGTLPLEDVELPQPSQEQCGWVHLAGHKKYPLHTGCNVVGRAAAATVQTQQEGHLQQQQQQREAEWAQKYGQPVVHGILLEDATVSSTHLRLDLSLDGTVCRATDLGSSNGTHLWGEGAGLLLEPQQPHVLRSGDSLKIGGCMVCVEFTHARKFAAGLPGAAGQQQHHQQQQQLLLDPPAGHGAALQLVTAVLPQQHNHQQQADLHHHHQQAVQAALPAGSQQMGQAQLLLPAQPPAQPVQRGVDGVPAHAAHGVEHEHQLQQQQPSGSAAGHLAGVVSPAVVHASHAISLHGGAVVILAHSPHAAAAIPQLLSDAALGGLLPGGSHMAVQHMQRAQQQQEVVPQALAEQPTDRQQEPLQQPHDQQVPRQGQEGPEHPPPQLVPAAQQAQQPSQQPSRTAGTPDMARPALSSTSNAVAGAVCSAGPSRQQQQQQGSKVQLPESQEVSQRQQQQQHQEPEENLQPQQQQQLTPGQQEAAASIRQLQQQQQKVVEQAPSAAMPAAASRGAAAAAVHEEGSDSQQHYAAAAAAITAAAAASRDTSYLNAPNIQELAKLMQAKAQAPKDAAARLLLAQMLEKSYASSEDYSGSQQQQGDSPSGPSMQGAQQQQQQLQWPPMPPPPMGQWPVSLTSQQLQAAQEVLARQQRLQGQQGQQAWWDAHGQQQHHPAVPAGQMHVLEQHQQQEQEQVHPAVTGAECLEQQLQHKGVGVPEASQKDSEREQTPPLPSSQQEQQQQQQQVQQLHASDQQQEQERLSGRQEPSGRVQQQHAGDRHWQLLPSSTESPGSRHSSQQPTIMQHTQAHQEQRASPRQQQQQVLDQIPEEEDEGAHTSQQQLHSQQVQDGGLAAALQQQEQVATQVQAVSCQQQQELSGEEPLLGTDVFGTAPARDSPQPAADTAAGPSVQDASLQQQEQQQQHQHQQQEQHSCRPCSTLQVAGGAACHDDAREQSQGAAAAGRAAAVGSEVALDVSPVAAAAAAGDGVPVVDDASRSPTRSPTASLDSADMQQETAGVRPQLHNTQQEQGEGTQCQQQPPQQQHQQQQQLADLLPLLADTEEEDVIGLVLWRQQQQQQQQVQGRNSSRSRGSSPQTAPQQQANTDPASEACGTMRLLDQPAADTSPAADADAVAADDGGGAGVSAVTGDGACSDGDAAAAAVVAADTELLNAHAAGAGAVVDQSTDQPPQQQQPPAAGDRQPVPLFWQADQQQQQPGLAGRLQAADTTVLVAAAAPSTDALLPAAAGPTTAATSHHLSVAQASLAAAAAAAPGSPAVLDASIGFGTQLAMQGLADLCKTPTSGGAAAGLRAMSRSDALQAAAVAAMGGEAPADAVGAGAGAGAAAAGEEGEGVHPHQHAFGYMQDAVALAWADRNGAKGRGGAGNGSKAARGRGRGRGGAARGAGGGGTRSKQAAARGRGGGGAGAAATGAAGAAGKKKRGRSRSSTPSLDEDDPDVEAVEACAAAGPGGSTNSAGAGAGGAAAAAAAGAGGGTAAAAATNAVCAEGAAGVRKSRRTTAGKKPLDIMFTQAAYLDEAIMPSPPTKARSEPKQPTPQLSPWSAATRRPLTLSPSSNPTGVLIAAPHTTLTAAAAAGPGCAVLQAQEQGVFKVPAAPSRAQPGHKRSRQGAGTAASTAAAGAAGVGVLPVIPGSAQQQQQQQTSTTAEMLQTAAVPEAKRPRGGGRQHGHDVAAASAASGGVEAGRASSAAAGGNTAAAAAADRQQQLHGTEQQSGQAHINSHLAVVSGPAGGAGASPDVVAMPAGTRADQLPVSTTYAPVVLAAAAAAGAGGAALHAGSTCTSDGSSGSSGPGRKKITSRKSIAFAGRLPLAAAGAGAGATAGTSVGPLLHASPTNSAVASDAAGGAAAGAAGAAGGVVVGGGDLTPHSSGQVAEQQHEHHSTHVSAAATDVHALSAHTGMMVEGGAGAPQPPAVSSITAMQQTDEGFPADAAAGGAASQGVAAAANTAGKQSPPAAVAAGPGSAARQAVPQLVSSPRRNAACSSRGLSQPCVTSSPRAAVAAAELPCGRSTRSGCNSSSSRGAGDGAAQPASKDVAANRPVIALVAGLPEDVQNRARAVFVHKLGGMIASTEQDLTVTHMLAAEDKVRTSFKLLLALARAVPVLNATPYTAACSSRNLLVPPERGHFVLGRELLRSKGIKSTTLAATHEKAEKAIRAGRTLLGGMPCLLSPSAVASETTPGNLKILLQAAGGVVVDQPEQLWLLQQQQQQQQQHQQDGLAAAQAGGSEEQQQQAPGPLLGPDGQPYGLILINPGQQLAAAGAASDTRSTAGAGTARGRRSSTGAAGGGGSGGSSSRRLGKEAAKDITWAVESGFCGWPLYNKDWLIRSVLSFSADWAAFCEVVPTAGG